MDNFKFLNGSWSISREEIWSRLHVRSTDMVVMGGALVEEIGSTHSHLDLYVISEECPNVEDVGAHSYINTQGGRVRAFFDYIGDSGMAFDAKFATFIELDEISNSASKLYARARTSTKILRARLEPESEDMFQKLLGGVCLQNDERFANFRAAFTKEKFCFIKYRNVTGGYPEFREIIGAWRIGEHEAALINMRDYLINQAQGLVNLAGITNYKPKFIWQNLRCLPESYSPIRDKLQHWLMSDMGTQETQRQRMLDACDLCDHIYSVSAHLLDNEANFYTSQEALSLTEAEYSREPYKDPQTVLEYQHRRRLFSDVAPPMSAHILRS